ncbi:hypothetical protein KOR34_41700 [Posidoniimonas corsicana]|uniref:PEP-CTERM protein-sorting domain-containing protein n=1 Tax=Posidoniimonas corsicana TaxID=1938618 RepID=A0A5C5V3S6_9BACT|nr:hypothetical protein [Posidoniimonas corsicana]TWT32407.1 hypothetical protein KOR34_41700 [Posidoniimonas corsicana]
MVRTLIVPVGVAVLSLGIVSGRAGAWAEFDAMMEIGTQVETDVIHNTFGFSRSFPHPNAAPGSQPKVGTGENIGNTRIGVHEAKATPHYKAMSLRAQGRADALPGDKAELEIWAEGKQRVRLGNYSGRGPGFPLSHKVTVDLSTQFAGFLQAFAWGNPEELDAAAARFSYLVMNETTGEVLLEGAMPLVSGEGDLRQTSFGGVEPLTVVLPGNSFHNIDTYGYVYSSGLSLANQPPLPPEKAAAEVEPFKARALRQFPNPAMGDLLFDPLMGDAAVHGAARLDSVAGVKEDDPYATGGLDTLFIDETIILPNRPIDIEISVETPIEGSSVIAINSAFRFGQGMHADAFGLMLGTGLGDGFSLSDDRASLAFLGLDSVLPPTLNDAAAGVDDPSAPLVLEGLLGGVLDADTGRWSIGAVVSDAADGVIDGMARFTLRQHVTGVAGDYDLDGIVTAADYERWRLLYGSAEPPHADGDRNGRVDAADYTVWRDSLADAAPVLQAARVPEPGAAGLIGGVLTLLWFRRPRLSRDRRAAN